MSQISNPKMMKKKIKTTQLSFIIGVNLIAID